MKFKIESSFHNTEKVFSIKTMYYQWAKNIGMNDVDVLSLLSYDANRQCDDRKYAVKKLHEIKAALCGQSDCRCVFTIISNKEQTP
jgi:hypothetical protein